MNDNDHVPEKKYKILTQIEHVLLRSDMYIGSLEPETVSRIVTEDKEVKELNVVCSKAFLKIVDEVISNAQDYQATDPTVSSITLNVNKENGWIKVVNNGKTTVSTKPFESSDKVVAQVVYGVLLSGSNFDDDQKRTWLGRNGVGVKLTNIFSKEFVVDLCDPETGEEHIIVWKDNMKKEDKHTVKKYSKKKACTTVLFLPDYERFKMSLPLSDDVCSLLKGRMQDLAFLTNKKVNVCFNDEQIIYSDLKSYVSMLGGTIMSYENIKGEGGSNLEVCLSVNCPKPHLHSFVNGARCYGTACNMVLSKITEPFSLKFPNATRLSQIVKDNICLIVNATVENPSFTSQTKEVLSTTNSKLGFEYNISNSLSKKLLESPIYKIIEQSIEKKDDKGTAKAIKNRSGPISDYEKATKIGGKEPCTLWITEGKSAKALVVAGFSVIGRDKNGVYPLRGKPLNSYDKPLKEVLTNREWLDLIHILKLDPNKIYDMETIKKLPYQHLSIVTDQDDDGSHILGLILVFFQKFFPTLIEIHPNFLQRFVTPIVRVKATQKSTYTNFYSLQAFKQWSTTNKCSEANYYKGLGTSSVEEAKEYFRASKKNTVNILFENELCHTLLSESYGKMYANKRKEMIQSINFESCVDYTKSNVTVHDFCKNELVHFSYANITRTIPGIDGLKPGQRKTIFTVFKDKSRIKYKVAELAAKVTGTAKYHHGEASLQETIAHMTQQYCGANQIRYLEALSQSGTRHDDRKVHAQPRYMNTKVDEICRLIFPEEEDSVLSYNEEDGVQVEPKCYAGTIPMILVNGAKGIGTGYSTEIPTFSIDDILEHCIHECNGTTTEKPLNYKTNGFNGSITKEDNSLIYKGTVLDEDITWKEKDASKYGKVLRITELPPQVWTNDVKEQLEKCDYIYEVVNHTKNDDIELHVHILHGEDFEKCMTNIKKMVTKRVSLNNMNLFDSNGILRNYTSATEIIKEHSKLKLSVCKKRLNNTIKNLEEDMKLASAKLTYITLVINEKIKVMNVKREKLKEQIHENGLGDFVTELSRMLLTSVTEEEIIKLKDICDKIKQEIERLKKKTPNEIWMEDILKLKNYLDPTSKRKIEEENEQENNHKKKKDY